MRHDPPGNTLMPARLARHWKAQLLILVAALALALCLSLLATTPPYYRHVSLAAHDAFTAASALPDAGA